MSRSVARGPDLAHLARVKHGPAAVFELQDEGAAFVEVARDAAHPAPAGLRIAGRVPVEVSGGIRLENVRAYAEAGPDYIAVGALTHSAPAVDISLDLEPAP